MDIRNDLDGLKTLLGVPPSAPAMVQPAKNGAETNAAALTGDRATLSAAASEVAQASSGSEVRMEKVTAVQAALANGTYQVPASAVAGKVVDAMLGQGSSSDTQS